MQSDKKTPEDIIHTIEECLEERKGKDRRKTPANEAYINPALERRKGGDRRNPEAK